MDGGPATQAALDNPAGLAFDGSGNLYIADWGNERVRKVDGQTGMITTVAGTGEKGFSGDGGPKRFDFSLPSGMRIRGSVGSVVIANGDGGPATQARLAPPAGVAIDGAGNLYIADVNFGHVRKVDGQTGVITTVAGKGKSGSSGDGGPATQAALDDPSGLAIDGSGNLYIADTGNDRVRRVDAATGLITTVAGTGEEGFSGDGGPATQAALDEPHGLAFGGAGNLYIADTGNDRVRRVDAATGLITTVAGTGEEGFSGDGGPATQAALDEPHGLAFGGAGNLYIADTGNDRVRRVDAATGLITTVAGTGEEGFSGDGGPATQAALDEPSGLAFDGAGNLYIADTRNSRVRRVSQVAVPVGGGFP